MAYMRADPDLSSVWLTARSCAYASTVSAPKKEPDLALGRSRSSFSTKIHILADRRGRSLRVMGSQRHNSPRGWVLVKAWIGAPLSCLIAVRAYDVDALRAWLARWDIKAIILARPLRNTSPVPRSGTVSGVPHLGERHRLAQTLAVRGYALRQIRTLFLYFLYA